MNCPDCGKVDCPGAVGCECRSVNPFIPEHGFIKRGKEINMIEPDNEDLETDKRQTLRAGIDELSTFIGNLTDDDTSYEKRARMLDTLSELLKLL